MRKREQREIIAVNLKELLKSRKITAKQVAKDLNVSYSTFGDWTRARTTPSPSQLKDVADYFRVSIGNLTSLNEDFSYQVVMLKFLIVKSVYQFLHLQNVMAKKLIEFLDGNIFQNFY